MSRRAMMRVNQEVVDSLCPLGQTAASVVSLMSLDYDVIRQVLHLPDSVRVTGVDNASFFRNNEAQVLLECPDFADMPDVGSLPEVWALYEWHDAPRFVRGVRQGSQLCGIVNGMLRMERALARAEQQKARAEQQKAKRDAAPAEDGRTIKFREFL